MKLHPRKTQLKFALVLGGVAGALALWSGTRFVKAAEPSDVTALMAEAERAPTLRANLLELTDEIGGRVPGTPAMDRAIRWGVEKFKAAGADEVHTEDFTIQHGWSEGATRLVAKYSPDLGETVHRIQLPLEAHLRAVSLGWGAPAQLTGVQVVDVGAGTHDDFGRAGDLKGKAVLVHSEPMQKWDDLFAEYQRVPVVMDESAKRGVRAILIESTRPHDLLYRHINTNHGEEDKVPALIVAREDAGRVARLLAEKIAVAVDVSMPNQLTGPIHTANVVAELRGSEKPDEIVVLGAHLDSWELGTGALDNGCNAALVIEAARAIRATGLVPRRSIRFALFTGEEQGMVGSWQYVAAHRAEMDKIRGVIIFDSGTGRVPGYFLTGRADIRDALQEILKPLSSWGVNNHTVYGDIGTDNWDFVLDGVPTMVANQEEANYLPNYHAASDTLDKVDMRALKLHTVIAALTAWGLADRVAPLGKRLSRAELEDLMRETGLDQQMKAMGFWPGWQNGTRGRQP